MPYHVVVDPQAKDAYELRGETRKFFSFHGPQSILAGPSDTGKTYASLLLLHLCCLRYPESQHVMARKTYASIGSSCAQTFNRIVAGAGVKVIGQDTPRLYNYPNGAQVWVAGLDNPEKALSSERDTIYVNQAEQLSMNDWEMLSSRCTGRGAVVRYPRLYGDCNPSGSLHWIRGKAKDGALAMFKAKHEDNPTLYDRQGLVLPGAQPRLDALSKLTGVRRKRLFEGVWATAEGAVYDNFDAAVHVIVRPRWEFKQFYLCQDEGYVNPAVVLLVGEDSDKRWHVCKEFYEAGKLEESVVRHALMWWREHKCVLDAVDAAAAGLIASLRSVGVNAVAGKGHVEDGCNAIRDRLTVQKDGRPRLTFDPSCVNCVNEFESYVFKAGSDVPVKEHDHTSDALRYLHDATSRGAGEVSMSRKRDPLVTTADRGRTLM